MNVCTYEFIEIFDNLPEKVCGNVNKLNASLSFNEILTFAVIRLGIVLKKYTYEYLIDCSYVPINRDTSDCNEVTRDDNTLNQLFR